MKVLHVISGLGRFSGGPSRSSQGLVAEECRAGVDAWIYSLDGSAPWIQGVRRFEARGVPSSKDIREFDLVHIHGIWNVGLHKVAALCRQAEVPYIIAPRGMLEPWSLKQKWLKKRIARFLYQDNDLKCATALHATAESEAKQFRRLGFKNQVIISPNGVTAPKGFVRSQAPGDRSQRRALFVSRMHPKKGVLELVDAWEKAKMDGWDCELVYTLRSDEEKVYEQTVKSRVHELGMDDAFIFTGQLDDDAKWGAYSKANLFILPTYSENFGIVVAEALWAGVPVITTKGTPWSDLESERCGWWIDLPDKGDCQSNWHSLITALSSAASISESELCEMGERGKKLVESRYSWRAACRSMLKGYNNIISVRAS